MPELSQFEKDDVVYDLKDTTARDMAATKVTAPEVAEVGQTIVVTEVDKNGKPTKWEARVFPKGNEYSLIQRVEIAESTARVDLDTDLDGNPFKVRNLVFKIRTGFPRDSASSLKVYANDSHIGRAPVVAAIDRFGDTSKTKYYYIEVEFTSFGSQQKYVMGNADIWSEKVNMGSSADYLIGTRQDAVIFKNGITSLILVPTNGFITGDYVEIYGVKED